MSDVDPETNAPTPPAANTHGRRFTFAEQELRLFSALVVLIGIGLFLAIPFVEPQLMRVPHALLPNRGRLQRALAAQPLSQYE